MTGVRDELDPALRRLLTGQLTSTQLPSILDLGVLTDGLDDLCARSLGVSIGEHVEWGACIVMDAGGLSLVHHVAGSSDAVTALDAPEDHAAYVGFAHVHLPDLVDGKPYLGFSERDFRATLADGDSLSLVCNGPDVFALVRTADCAQPRGVPGEEEFKGWEQLYDDAIRGARREMALERAAHGTASDALNRALWQVNRELCRRLGLAFYRGQRGQPLTRTFRPTPYTRGAVR